MKNSRLKLAPTISSGALITVAINVTEMLTIFTDKAINGLSKESKEAIYLLRPLLIISLSLISATK